MRKKKLIICVLLLLLAVVAVGVLILPPRIQIVGKISSTDLAEVKHIARHEIWRGTLPNYSWKSIKQLPGNLKARASTHVLRIEADSPSAVSVIIGIRRRKDLLTPAYYQLYLVKSPKGWKISSIVGGFDPPFDAPTMR